jgi:outer membrane protein assembly factor BamA
MSIESSRLAVTLVLLMPALAAAQPAPIISLFQEPSLLTKAIAEVEKREAPEGTAPKDGLYAEFGHMITGSGWIAAGPGYRQHLFGGRAVGNVSGAISWRTYKALQGRLEFPRLANNRVLVGSKVLWRDYTQVRYYGIGPDTLQSQLSDYRVRSTNLVGYASWQLHPIMSVGASLGWLSRPRLSSSAGLFDRGDPDTQFAHPTDPAVSLARQPRFTHGELHVAVDTRNESSYPTHGSVARASLSRYRDHPSSGLAFNRYEVEGAHFLLIARRSVLAVRGWGVFSDAGDRRAVPFYLLPSLGGHNTLRGYTDYRFHDRHLLVANIESRWAFFPHVDAAFFFDAGGVAPTVSRLGFDRTSYGVGFRVHTRQSTLGRLDVAHGREGWRVMFKLSDAFRLSRHDARTAIVPFVP